MQHRVIISGGGTGGHIYPALSIAGALRKIEPDIEILFVGAEGKMEMEKVPAAGYRIIGLPVKTDRCQSVRAVQGTQKHPQGRQNHKGVPSGRGGGSRRICQRTHAVESGCKRHPYTHTGTELLRGTDQ